MESNLPTESERLIKFSRRGLWIALTLLMVLGAYAVVMNVFPDGEMARVANRLAGILPIVIVIVLAALRSSLKGASTNPRGVGMSAVLNDELRKHALNLAYRNGLVAVLLVQPLLALLLISWPLAQPVVLMASSTALAGVCSVLCSLLVYDR